jgi:hypothetical protein
VTPNSLVEDYRGFARILFVRLQLCKASLLFASSSLIPPKRMKIYIGLHHVTCQIIVLFIDTALKTLNPKYRESMEDCLVFQSVVQLLYPLNYRGPLLNCTKFRKEAETQRLLNHVVTWLTTYLLTVSPVNEYIVSVLELNFHTLIRNFITFIKRAKTVIWGVGERNIPKWKNEGHTKFYPELL